MLSVKETSAPPPSPPVSVSELPVGTVFDYGLRSNLFVVGKAYPDYAGIQKRFVRLTDQIIFDATQFPNTRDIHVRPKGTVIELTVG